MNLIITFFVWTWLLCIGLVAPAALPAGGAQESIIQHRRNNIGSPIIALKEFNLLTSASTHSSTLTRVKVGTPVKVIKVWESNESRNWLLVSVVCQNFDQLFYRRGWVEI
jgi:hypothetical protein